MFPDLSTACCRKKTQERLITMIHSCNSEIIVNVQNAACIAKACGTDSLAMLTSGEAICRFSYVPGVRPGTGEAAECII